MRKKILEVNVDFDMTSEDVMTLIEAHIIKKSVKSELLCTTNPYFIMSAQNDVEFKNVINNAMLSVPDGVGVLYANYYLKKIKNLKRNNLFPLLAFFIGIETGILGYFNRKALGVTITGVELTDKICELSAEKKYTVFFLGGRPRNKKGQDLNNNYDMAMDAKNIMEKKYPGLNIIGATSQFSRQSYDDENTLTYIKACMKKADVSSIDFLFVAYNPVDQEKWINRNAHKIPAKLSIGVGRVLDYITNTMSKPPRLVDKLYMGWLYAFVCQPWRIKRIFTTFPVFPLRVYLTSLMFTQTLPEND